MKKSALLLNWFLLLLPAALYGQQRYAFKHFYADDGLSDSRVTCIYQDHYGFIWLGTARGLNRFDGYSFKVYKNTPNDSTTIRSNIIEAIFEDSRENLWIGSSEGLSLYNRKLDCFENLKAENDNTKGAAVVAIFEDADGTIWTGGWQGVSKVNMEEKKLYLFRPEFSPSENSKSVNDLLIDQENNLWAATSHGLDCYNFKSRQLSSLLNDPAVEGALPYDVTALIESEDGTLWIGTGKGLFARKRGSSKFQRIDGINTKFIYDLYQDKNSIFIGTESGFFEYIKRSGKIHYYATQKSENDISDKLVQCIMKDFDQNLWLGTYNGLNLFSKTAGIAHIGKVELNRPGFANPFTLSMLVDNEGYLWTGTAEGIAILNIPSRGDVKFITSRYPALKAINKAVISMTSDGVDNIWFTVWPGKFYQYNKKTNVLRHLPTPVSCQVPVVLYSGSNTLWFASEQGFFSLNTKTNQYHPIDKLGNHNIHYLFRDRRENLWAGFQLGLVHYDIRDSIAYYYRKKTASSKALNVNEVNWVYEDADSSYWIGTDLGLHLLKKDGTFENLRSSFGFSDHSVSAILEDDHDNLWISSNEGLHRFNKKTYALKNFDISDGLQGREFCNAAVELPDGRMVFAGKKGINIFYPDSICDNPRPPRLAITDFKILNQKVPIDGSRLSAHISVADELNLDYSDTEFSFEFVALSFSAPYKNQYAYKMEGFDKDWNYSGTRRFASYTNLQNGKAYTFRVKASNNDNVWNEEGVQIKIYIHPPFWETWWFKIAMYSTTAAMVYLAYRIRINTVRKHRIELRRQVKEQTTQLKLANEQIEKWNEVLKEHNKKLQENVKDLSKAHVLQRPVSFEEFKTTYSDEETCYKLLDELKWKEGFSCTRCSNKQYAPGPVPFSRRCSKCNFVERITSGTIFARLKFPLPKAFHLLFLVTGSSDLTVKELSDTLSLRQQTCWIFRSKIEKIIKEKGGIKNHRDGWKSLILTDEP